MTLISYLIIAYFLTINIITLIIYIRETSSPPPRTSALLLLILPVIGGFLGAILANYFAGTEYKEVRYFLHKPLAFLPPIMLFTYLIVALLNLGIENIFYTVWATVYAHAGLAGCILLTLNILSFFLVIIRKSSYYFAPIGNYFVPDIVLIPIIILGGALGGLFAKIIFNFKEDWSCNSTKRIQNFVYNRGMFFVCALQILLYFYFSFFK